MRFADLFCGIGGFHIAAKNAGCEPVWACDIDKHARLSYACNYKIEPAGDITKINPRDVPDFDLLFAGFPCQAFSLLGHRNPTEHRSGNNLFLEIARFLDAKKPQGFVLENVTGILSSDGGRTMAIIHSKIKELGYHMDARILDLRRFGIPQKRKRVIFVGSKKPFPKPTGWFNWRFEKRDLPPITDFLDKNPSAEYNLSPAHLKMISDFYTITNNRNLTKPPLFYTLTAQKQVVVSDTCPTLVTNPVYFSIDLKRTLTNKERLRLMGFPGKYKIVVSRNQHVIQTGNAVAPPMVQPVIENLILHLNT